VGHVVKSLAQHFLSDGDLGAFVISTTESTTVLTSAHRDALASRLRALSSSTRRHLDAWSIEHGGQPHGSFTWSPSRARRALGRAALARHQRSSVTALRQCVRDEIDEQLLRYAAGHAHSRSLASWLAHRSSVELALCIDEALSWATTAFECAQGTRLPWSVATTDAFYDVAGARTSFRGQRDLVVGDAGSTCLIRLRSGAPGAFAGAGLRVDLVVDALSRHSGEVAPLIVGVWPDAGVALSVEGTLSNVRSGARDLVRAALVQQRSARVAA